MFMPRLMQYHLGPLAEDSGVALSTPHNKSVAPIQRLKSAIGPRRAAEGAALHLHTFSHLQRAAHPRLTGIGILNVPEIVGTV